MGVGKMLYFGGYKQWHIPLSARAVRVREALSSLKALGAPQEDIPLIVKLLENPDYRIPGFTIFHGAVDLHTHDFIHILLGRGLMPKDEAFTIGFTMGSTNEVTALEEELFCAINKYFYPKVYRFGDEEIAIFKDAVRLGKISNCRPLDQVDYQIYTDSTIGEMRKALGVEEDLLKAYFRIEQTRYPTAPESQRLLNDLMAEEA